MKRFLLLITLIQLGTGIICIAQKHGSSHTSRSSSSHSSVSHNASRSPSVNHSQSSSHSINNSSSHSNNHGFSNNNHHSNSGSSNYHSSGTNNGRNFSGGNNTISQQPGRVIQTRRLGRPVYPKVASGNTTPNKHIAAPRLPSLAGYRAPVSVYYPGDMYYPYAGYYGYNPYFYNPYFYNPFFDMWSMGASFMFTPHYCLGRPVMSGYNTYNDNNYQDAYDNSPEVSSGYVVYENDTINGNITITKRAIQLNAADSAQEYDYVFRNHKKGLKCVMATNEDQKELNLVRLGDNQKKLYRLVHNGKLNIYDCGRNFIYRPEDIDASSISVVYNGEVISLESQNRDQVRLRLASFINKVYGTDINPNNMDWNSLLIYIDKLD